MTHPTAEQCLVATCARLAMMTVRNESYPVWVAVLSDVLPECAGGSKSMAPLRGAAHLVVHARSEKDRGTALARLRFEVQVYFGIVAAARHEAWKKAKAGAAVHG